MTDVSQAAFDFVDRAGHLSSQSEIIHELQRTSSVFGFDNFCMSGLPSPGERLDPYILLSGWPEDWMSRYLELDYVHVDPVCHRLLSSDMPFLWEDAPYDGNDAKARQVMNEAPSFGLNEGFAIPIYTTHGFQAAVTFSARKLELDPRARSALHLVGIYAHNAARAIAVGDPRRRRRKLSKREIECLKWASAGKSSWDISAILSISERTTNQYIASAAAKLNAVNRTQAVAEALRLKIIS